jgi:CRP-like cAMP-binding protein
MQTMNESPPRGEHRVRIDVPQPLADTRLAERFSPEVISAWQASPFSWMPQSASTRLLASGVEYRFAAGQEVHADGRAGNGSLPDGYCLVVATGLIRIYRRHQTRQVTLRYVGPGFILGVPMIYAGTGGTESQAVIDSRGLGVRSDLLRQLARTDVDVGWVLCHVLARCLHENHQLLCANVFRPLKERVAHHLLDLAETDASGRIVVRANPQQIADAVGTVREVVTRVLKRMREQGLVVRDGRTFVLPDPAALHAVAKASEESEG